MVKSSVKYFDSQEKYATKKLDNHVLHVDSLVEMVDVHDTAIFGQNENISMLIDNKTALSDAGNITRGSRRAESNPT